MKSKTLFVLCLGVLSLSILSCVLHDQKPSPVALTTAVEKVPTVAPPPVLPHTNAIPYGVFRSRAQKYNQMPDVVIAYKWVGYESSSSPQSALDEEWPWF